MSATVAEKMKIYIYGVETNGQPTAIKIGRTRQHLNTRASQRTGGFFPSLVSAKETLLAAFNTHASVETKLKTHFKRLQIEGEYFRLEPELEEYVFWLRHQSFVWLHEDTGPDDVVQWQEICPREDRRMKLPVSDGLLISDEDSYPPVDGSIDLRETVWSKYAIFQPPWNDYYTPRWIINAVREGMGGIDLDAASHWAANRVHEIHHYFTEQMDAHRQDWRCRCKQCEDEGVGGRVWLNPPYGDNQPWIDDILRNFSSGDMTQLAWLSPSYVFNKKQAQPVMEKASLVICLTCPTDKMFWGYGHATNGGRRALYCGADEPALGRNDPHWIVYMGGRPDQMADAFLATGRGYPMTPYRGAPCP